MKRTIGTKTALASVLGLLLLGPVGWKCLEGGVLGEEEPRREQGSESALAMLPATEDAEVYRRAAEAAWAFVEENTVEETGLVTATDTYEVLTIWDVGSLLGALYSAHGLGLIPEEEFHRRTARVLETLQSVPLYDEAVYNKSYYATTARMGGNDGRPSSTGDGWSATDLGRFLVWLKIVAEEHPRHADAARRVAERIDWSRVVMDGYMRGEDVGSSGRARQFQEGRIGYEQYAAIGFDLWGHPPAQALNLLQNATPVEVAGQQLLADVRGDDRLNSEPFILYGLELGWTPEMRGLAWRVLAAQEARWEETGQVTMVSEDAVHRPPYYFYYYNLYGQGEPFLVDAHGPLQGEPPRWVSTKAAYGWHALVPTPYTWLAVRTVEPARGPGGWASGVFEGSGESTRTLNVNTAAVVLESALYAQRGRPFLSPSR